MQTHCGHVFCKYPVGGLQAKSTMASECIMRATAVKSMCPLCKTSCTRRMIRASEEMQRLVEQFSRLAAAVDQIGQPAVRPAPEKKRAARVVTPLKRSAVRRLALSPVTSQQQSTDIEHLRTVNERIMSEITRIDAQLSLHSRGGLTQCSGEPEVVLSSTGLPSQASTCATDSYVPEHRLVVTTTMLGPEERARVRSWTESVGGIYSPLYDDSVTHVIAREGEEQLAVRSMKTMQAIINGSWLLPYRWVEACVSSGAVRREEAFELQGDQYSDDEGPRRSRMSRLNSESKLLDGYSVYLFGVFGTPSRGDLGALLACAGARVIGSVAELARMRSPAEEVLVIGDPAECCDLERDQGVIERFAFVQTEWLYASISAYEPLPVDGFRFL